MLQLGERRVGTNVDLSYSVLSRGSKGVTEPYHHFSHFFVLNNPECRMVTKNSKQTQEIAIVIKPYA